MEELMECPVCHQTYTDRKVCPRDQTRLRPVKKAEDDAPAQAGAVPQSEATTQPAHTPEVIEQAPPQHFVPCSSCGRPGEPGSVCSQCGETIPGEVQSIPVEAAPAHPAAAIPADGTRIEPGPVEVMVGVLHDGTRIELPIGQRIVLGRESDDCRVTAAFSKYDVVSRRHCEIVIDRTGRGVTVRDCGSTNHTWIDNPSDYLKKNEVRTVKLPATIHLGQRVSITIGGE